MNLLRSENIRLDVSRKLPEPCLRYRQYDTGTQVVAYIERDGVPMSLDGLRCRLVAQTPRGTVWADMETDECSAAYTLTTALTGSVGIVHPYVEVLGADGSVVAATGTFALMVDKAGYTAPADLPTDQSVLDQVGALARTAGDAAQAAKVSEGAAAGSAAQAAAAQAAAESARDAAETAKAASATSAGKSSKSETAAAESAASAAGDAAKAVTAAAAASKDAAAAAASATSAASSTASASESASAASGSADRAASSQAAAKTSETAAKAAQASTESASTAASKSAGSAASAAEAAASSAAKAATSAAQAATSAQHASESRTAAASSASEAASSATSAQSSADAAAKAANQAKAVISDAKAEIDEAIGKATEASAEAADAAADASAAAAEARGWKQLDRDQSTGHYSTASLVAYAAEHRTGKRYVFKIPKGASRTVVPAGAAAGIGKLVPATATSPADDPWEREGGPWWHETVNGGCDPDGTPWVDALETRDYAFSRTDNGRGNNCYEMSLVRWIKYDETSDADYDVLTVCDTQQEDLSPEPGAILPDGTLRPYMLTPTYGLSVDDQGRPRSVSGAPLKIRTVSHDSLIKLCATATTGYSGTSVFDDWYLKFHQLTKTLDKSSQATWPGCSALSLQCAPALAETGVSRVVLAADKASAIPDGCSVSVGSCTAPTDRGTAAAYDACDMARVVSRETLADGTVALNLEVPGGAFDTSTAGQVSTMPWWTGSTDRIVGDGQASADAKHPCRIGGVETMPGAYEVSSGLLLRSTGSGWHWVVFDTRDSKAGSVPETSVASTAIRPADGSWVMRLTMTEGGFLAPSGTGGSSSSGLGDMCYGTKDEEAGVREVLRLGGLWSGLGAGLSCVYGGCGSGGASWSIVSRLSVTGRMGVSAA